MLHLEKAKLTERYRNAAIISKGLTLITRSRHVCPLVSFSQAPDKRPYTSIIMLLLMTRVDILAAPSGRTAAATEEVRTRVINSDKGHVRRQDGSNRRTTFESHVKPSNQVRFLSQTALLTSVT